MLPARGSDDGGARRVPRPRDDWKFLCRAVEKEGQPIVESDSENGVSAPDEEDELDDQFDDTDYEPDD